MTIPSGWKSRDDVPDWAKDHVEETEDGRFALSVEGMTPSSKIDEFRTNNLQLRKTVEKLEKSLKGSLSASDRTSLETEVQDLKDRLAAGEHDEKIQELVAQRTSRMRDDHQAELTARDDEVAKRDQRLSTVTSRLAKDRIENATLIGIKEVGGVKDGAVDDILANVNRTFSIDEESDFAPVARDEEGNILRGKDGVKPLTPAEHLASIKKAGSKAGVWFETADSPPSDRRFGSKKSSSSDSATGRDRIRNALREQKAS